MAQPYRTVVTVPAAFADMVPPATLIREVGGEIGDAGQIARARLALEAATLWCERYVGVSIMRRSYRSSYWSPGGGPLFLGEAGDIVELSLQVKVGGNAIPDVFLLDGWMVCRRGAGGWPWGLLTVDYSVGYSGASELPGDLAQAIVGLAALFITRVERPAGVVTADVGGITRMVYTDGGVPPWIWDTLAPYRRLTV